MKYKKGQIIYKPKQGIIGVVIDASENYIVRIYWFSRLKQMAPYMVSDLVGKTSNKLKYEVTVGLNNGSYRVLC